MKLPRTILVLVLALTATGTEARQAPRAPQPTKEHEWLMQLVGEWETEASLVVAPGQPPVTAKGAESVRSLGSLWIVAENKTPFMGVTITGVLTLGYDPHQARFIGVWVDSVTNHLWRYEGSLDATGKILTLNAEGPNAGAGGKLAKFKDVIEFKDKDHKIMTSSMEANDGKWMTFATIQYRRKN